MAEMDKSQTLLTDTVAEVSGLIEMVHDRTDSERYVIKQVSTLAWRSYRNAESDSEKYLLGLAGQIVGLALYPLAISRTAANDPTNSNSQAVLDEIVYRLQRLLEKVVSGASEDRSMLRQAHRLALEAAFHAPEHEAYVLDIASGLLAVAPFNDSDSE
jgi:hypothetical protein